MDGGARLADGLFVPVDAASLEQLVQVTAVITELTRILVAPLGLPAAVQLLDDAKLDAAVRDRLAIGNMAAVELACETVGISSGAHALAAANHEKAPEMRKLLRAQEQLIQRIFEPARVVDLPANVSVEYSSTLPMSLPLTILFSLFPREHPRCSSAQ